MIRIMIIMSFILGGNEKFIKNFLISIRSEDFKTTKVLEDYFHPSILVGLQSCNENDKKSALKYYNEAFESLSEKTNSSLVPKIRVLPYHRLAKSKQNLLLDSEDMKQTYAIVDSNTGTILDFVLMRQGKILSITRIKDGKVFLIIP